MPDLYGTVTAEQNIRFALGVTGEREALVSEEELLHFIDLYPSDWRLAAAAVAEMLAAKAINDPTQFSMTGLMGVSWSDQAESWRRQAKRLREEVKEMQDIENRAVGMQSVFLTRERNVAERAEYSPRRIKRLR